MPTIVAALALGAGTARADRVSVSATWVPPARAGANGSVAVRFETNDPDVHVNRDPAPRLVLDPDQRVLVDRQAPRARRGGSADVEAAGFYEAGTPVTFAAALAAGAQQGHRGAGRAEGQESAASASTIAHGRFHDPSSSTSGMP